MLLPKVKIHGQRISWCRESLSVEVTKSVLGITKLDEDDDDLLSKSGLGGIGQNLTDSSRPFGMKELFPNLQKDYDTNKKMFG